MENRKATTPDHTAIRTALWRALHSEVDASPAVLVDQVGLQLVGPESTWRERPDMHPQGTRGYRASIVGRARWIEDLVEEEVRKGVRQYVILGAGLDAFAQRRPELMTQLKVFEIDKPDTQAWKQQRLADLGFDLAKNLHFVPVDFEAGESWWDKLANAGFNRAEAAIVVSTGVSMYLTKEANVSTLRQLAGLAAGSTFAMTFLLPLELLDPAERPMHERVFARAREAGTPFLSFFRPEEIVSLAQSAGFREAKHVGGEDIRQRYFAGRSDGLAPAAGEDFLIAKT